MNITRRAALAMLAGGAVSLGMAPPAAYGDEGFAAEAAKRGYKGVYLRGRDRYETSAAVSASAFEQSDSVVIVSGTNFPDGLVASSLAGYLDAPILLVRPTGQLPKSISKEMLRLEAKHAVVVGGASSVSDDVFSQLQLYPGDVERIAGKDRYETACCVANYIESERSDTAIVTNGYSYADGISIGAYAYATKSPVFLTNAKGYLSNIYSEWAIQGGSDKCLIMGNESAVPNDIKQQLEENHFVPYASQADEGMIEKTDKEKSPRFTFYRFGGNDRYQTNVAVLKWLLGEHEGASIQPAETHSLEEYYLVTGGNYPDGLCAMAAAGHKKGFVILANNSHNGLYAADAYVFRHHDEITKAYVVGDYSSVPDEVRDYYMERT